VHGLTQARMTKLPIPPAAVSTFEPAAAIPPKLLTIKETAAYLRVSRAGLYRSIIQNLESVHIGGRHLVLRESIDRYLDRLIAKEAA
jgi:excisionase family DNA binding protein